MNRATWKLVLRMNCHKLASAAKATNAATSLAALRSGVDSALANSQMVATSSSVRHASPNSNLRLKPMLFHAAIEGAAAQPELRSGEGNVEMVHSERPFDHLPFELVEIEAAGGQGDECGFGPGRQREILEPIAGGVGHDHRTLGGVTQCADVAGPVMLDQRLHHVAADHPLRPIIFALVQFQ